MATVADPIDIREDQKLDLNRVEWPAYVGISNALPDGAPVRLVYADGSLTFLTTSRRHDWHARILSEIVEALATARGIEWETAGRATFRMESLGVGVEGDATYYFGRHADLMRGPGEIDLNTQPPPDLVIEVEVTHSAERAVGVWSRLGVTEIWRLDVPRNTATFICRSDEGGYASASDSRLFPGVAPSDLIERIAKARSVGSIEWRNLLREWAEIRSRPGTE